MSGKTKINDTLIIGLAVGLLVLLGISVILKWYLVIGIFFIVFDIFIMSLGFGGKGQNGNTVLVLCGIPGLILGIALSVTSVKTIVQTVENKHYTLSLGGVEYVMRNANYNGSKYIVYDEAEGVFFDCLPDEYRAECLDEIRNIIVLSKGSVSVGTYSSGKDARQYKYTLTFLNEDSDEPVSETVWGKKPASTVKSSIFDFSSAKYGSKPKNQAIIDACETMIQQDQDQCTDTAGLPVCYKPVIYLYPEQETNINVYMNYAGELTCTYPAYNGGWSVTAQPDGTLTDADGQTYNYLYWEGVGDIEYDFSEGFCVAGNDTAAFLEDVLSRLGLTRKEANEFIVYWLPKMESNPYNLIAFQSDVYTQAAQLTVEPAPDTMLRVFMAWEPLETAVNIPEQTIITPERTGFTVVEWGGTELGRTY